MYVCVSHCVSSLSPAGSHVVSDTPHVASGQSYLPPGQACFQCDESRGFDRVSAGVPLVRRAHRRRRDTHRLAADNATQTLMIHVSSSIMTVLHPPYFCYIIGLSVSQFKETHQIRLDTRM